MPLAADGDASTPGASSMTATTRAEDAGSQNQPHESNVSGITMAGAKESTSTTDDAFGLSFAALSTTQTDVLFEPEPQQVEQWQSTQETHSQQTDAKTDAGGRSVESTQSAAAASSSTNKPGAEQPLQGSNPTTCATRTPPKSRRSTAARKSGKPTITINTGAGSVGAKRPPPTPVSPPSFSWNDILRVQNLIERCLQQYLTKRDILAALQEQANVDPAFSNVVWQKLEEQNPAFFRAYTLQLQLKEQILAFNYLVGQQKEMAAKGGKRHLHYSSVSRASTSRMAASAAAALATTPTTTTLPPINVDSRVLLRASGRATKQQRTPHGGKRTFQGQHMGAHQLVSPPTSTSMSAGPNSTLFPPPSPLPLPSPIKTDLDTHAFFT